MTASVGSTGVAYTTAVVLAVVFTWAGLAKHQRPRATAAAFEALGLPAPTALARTVPALEVGLAALLVLAPRAGGVAAAALLAGFSAVLGAAVLRGRAVACGCFGAGGSSPAGATELMRNAVLAGAAVLAATAPGPVLPTLADVVVVTTALAAGAVGLALAGLRHITGSVLALGPFESWEVPR